ncbi:MAG TPA: NAD(P)/FAD-dependent oxidoreductase [Stellaceae bacterium]|nr:NAD(P)/FAD-dependent oxidoreductase [Stellaceae bacterium]
MTNRLSCDVLVVGARCAGASTAMLLARGGLRVLLVDRGEYGTDTISTHAFMRAGVLQLERWGLLPHIEQAGTPPVRNTAFHYGDDVVEIEIGESHGVRALYAPRRTVLDRVLVDAAAEAGADVRFRHSLVELKHAPGGRVSGALIRGATDELIEVDAEFVVGADGIGSSVARLAGAPVLRQFHSASAIIYGHWRGLPARGYRWHYSPGASAGVIPTNDGMHCVFAAMPAARFRAGLRGVAAYRRILAEAAPDVAAALDPVVSDGPVWTFAGRPGFMRQAWGPGWALVGDSGYFKDPLTAHGMTDALRDAELLARAVLEGNDQALARFAALRDEFSLRFLAVTDAIASFDWDLDTLRQYHFAVNAAMKAEVEHLAALEVVSRRSPIPMPALPRRAHIEEVIQ